MKYPYGFEYMHKQYLPTPLPKYHQGVILYLAQQYATVACSKEVINLQYLLCTGDHLGKCITRLLTDHKPALLACETITGIHSLGADFAARLTIYCHLTDKYIALDNLYSHALAYALRNPNRRHVLNSRRHAWALTELVGSPENMVNVYRRHTPDSKAVLREYMTPDELLHLHLSM